jgi:hypothetical protein
MKGSTMIAKLLRSWLRRARWYCLFALIMNFLIAMSILSLPMGAFIQHILSALFSIVLLLVALVILIQGIDGTGWLFEAGARAQGGMRIVAFLAGVILILFCGALLWLMIVRLRQPFGDFLLGSDAALMQVEILVVGALAWREAHRMRIEQQQKK